MKKKLILSILVIVTLFTITGCSKSNSNVNNNLKDNKEIVTIQGEQFRLKSEQTLNELHYKENYVDFHSDAIGNMRTMNYTKEGNLIFEVRIMYDENRSVEELQAIVETQYNTKAQSKEINGIKYIYYEYEGEDGVTIHHYLYVHNRKVYSIGFFLGENYGNIEEVFMNNVSFG